MTAKMQLPATSRFFIVLRPATSVPGEWVGHCLNIDVVSQGRSPSHALEMTVEACTMVLIEDARHGLDPNRRRAPDEFWRDFGAMMGRAHPLPPETDPRLMDGLTDHIEGILASVEFVPAERDDHQQVEIREAWAASEHSPTLSH